MRKYILKPGKHQFAPGSPPVHSHDNLTDEEAEWYLQRYPHIAKLFALQSPEVAALEKQKEQTKLKRKRIKGVAALTPLSGDKEGE